MKKSKFSEEQITYALRQADAGTPVPDVCWQIGISEATSYVWKKRFGHLDVADARRALAHWYVTTFGASIHRACRLAQFSRAAW